MSIKMKCSIKHCPWKARYSFGMRDYYECWYHRGMIPWFNVIWDLLFYYPRFFYGLIRWGYCHWEVNPYLVFKEMIEDYYGVA